MLNAYLHLVLARFDAKILFYLSMTTFGGDLGEHLDVTKMH